MKSATRLGLFLVSTFLLVASAAWAGPDGGSPVEPPPQKQAAPSYEPVVVPELAKTLRDICPPSTNPCIPGLMIAGEISEITAEKFAFNLQLAEWAGAKAVLVTILSPGGEIQSSRVIAKAISTAKIPVDCVAAVAASGAFLAFQSCRTRYVLPKSLMITHDGRYMEIEGPVRIKDLMEMETRLRADSLAVATVISARMKMSLSDYEAKIADGDWRMIGVEAVAAHAADAVVPSLEAAYKLVEASVGTAKPNSCKIPHAP